MGLYFHKTPKWLQRIYPGLTWKKGANDQTIYLTFDDGPIPEVTPFVLQQLKEYDARATFFCVGHNIEKHPEIFDQVLREGHMVANHSFNHLVGWDTDNELYYENIYRCQQEIEKYTGIQQRKLFRPPHGRIKRKQAKHLKDEFEIIMWTYLTGDFDHKLDKGKCLTRSLNSVTSGDIVIFHDSLKALDTMSHTLPRFLKHFSQLGYRFNAL